MKKKQDKLFALIKTMSMPEKRYFKLSAQSDKKYVGMFDAIDKLDAYDEATLIRLLKKKDMITTYLAGDKNYLYKLLLKSLRAFHAGKSINLQVKEYLDYVEILYYKGLHKQCSKILIKAKKMAAQLDLHALLLEIMIWERKIEGAKFTPKNIEDLFEAFNKNANILINLNQYNRLYYQSVLLRKLTNKARNLESTTNFEELAKNPLLQSQNAALSRTAKIRYYEIYANYYYSIDQPHKEYECNEQLLNLMNEEINYLDEYPYEYVVIYSRILTLQRKLFPKKYPSTLAHFREIPNKVSRAKQEITILVFTISHGDEMSMYLNNGQFKQALPLVAISEKFFEKHQQKIPNNFKLTAYYRFAYLYIGLEDYPNALNYINKVLNEFDEQTRPDVYYWAKIVNLLIHYELQNYQLLKYIIRSTQNYLKKRKQLYKAETLVIDFLNKALRTNEAEKLKPILIKTLEKFNLLYQDEYEQRAANYFDFTNWLAAKIKGKTFAEIIQQNNK